jgi:hypothetical protein
MRSELAGLRGWTYANSDSDCYGNRYRYPNGYPNSDRYRYTDSNAYGHAFCPRATNS